MTYGKPNYEIGGNYASVIFLLGILAVGAIFIWQYFAPTVCQYEVDFNFQPSFSALGNYSDSAQVRFRASDDLIPFNRTVTALNGSLILSGHATGQIYCRDVSLAILAFNSANGRQYTITRVK